MPKSKGQRKNSERSKKQAETLDEKIKKGKSEKRKLQRSKIGEEQNAKYKKHRKQ